MTKKAGWEKFFDGHAPVYMENSFTQNTMNEVDFLVKELGLKRGAAILDVGCGTGRHAVELARRGFAVTGVDLSSGMLAKARKHADDAIEQPLAILRRVARALKPGARCLFTVLNGYSMARRHTPAEANKKVFDPLTLSELSEVGDPGDPTSVRERAFVPTELKLLFRTAGLNVLHIWGGTAGDWDRRQIKLDEWEVMVVAEKRSTGL
jgi:SAM-dependent methyltransferase